MKNFLQWFFIVLSLVIFSNCASRPPAEVFYTRLYSGNFEEIWSAALKALSDYPLKLSNKDAGKVQTEVVNGPYNDVFFTTPEPIELPERFRYSMKLNFARLEEVKGQQLIRVRIIKELERFHDFYTGWVTYPSDGLEEKLLLYRIEHLAKMEKHLLEQ